MERSVWRVLANGASEGLRASPRPESVSESEYSNDGSVTEGVPSVPDIDKCAGAKVHMSVTHQVNRDEACGSGNGRPRLPFGPSVKARRTALNLPKSLPLDEWKRIGEHISVISNSSTWWLGDWLVYGQEMYPDRYRTAVAETMLDYQTLRNYAWVARKFSVSRRRDTLSFQHHLEVAALSHADQDLWLERAVHFRWSKAELRRRIKAAGNGQMPSSEDCDTTDLSVSITNQQKQRWQSAAEAAGRSLTEWLVQVADAAADNLATGDVGIPLSA
jgi:hypothetical protein